MSKVGITVWNKRNPKAEILHLSRSPQFNHLVWTGLLQCNCPKHWGEETVSSKPPAQNPLRWLHFSFSTAIWCCLGFRSQPAACLHNQPFHVSPWPGVSSVFICYAGSTVAHSKDRNASLGSHQFIGDYSATANISFDNSHHTASGAEKLKEGCRTFFTSKYPRDVVKEMRKVARG